MEEIMALRRYLEERRYDEALHIAIELEDMARDDKIIRIGSFAEILLIHLIKRAAEGRTTRSWDDSIDHAIEQICRYNKRRESGGYYLRPDELQAAVREVYPSALRRAAREAFEGQFSPQQLAQKIDAERILNDTLAMILNTQHNQ
jgi:hypothetical protein